MTRAFNIHASVITYIYCRIFVSHYFVAYNLVLLKRRRDRKDDGFLFRDPRGGVPGRVMGGVCVRMAQ